MVCLWAADEDGLKGLKLGRCKNKTQGFGLEVKWSRFGYIFGAGESYGLYAVLWCIAQSTRVDITACGQHMRACVCLVVGGTALVKMTQPICDFDHLPKPAPRSDESDICHPGGRQAKPFPLKALPRFGRSAHFRQGIVAHHRSTEARKHSKALQPCCWDPRSHLLPSSSTGSDNPCTHHLDMWAEGRWPAGASSRGLRVCGWAMGQAWNQTMTLACRPRRRPRKAGKLFQGLPQVFGGLASLAAPGVVAWNRP